MRLTSITLHGFKSFGAKTTLTFTPGITAVIGPNGSGKSNLAEAIRWVLGEQSLKQLRGKERDDIIFSGTGVQKASRAKVSVVFDNSSQRFPLSAAEITITRQLCRDGESEYLLNGDPVRLVDLQQMLAEAGIGTKSYTVISQGTVDKYLTASPSARKELFDEATGVKALYIKLHQAEKKLKATREHSLHIRTILSELEPRLQVLERQVHRHEERTQLLDVFSHKQTAWFHHRWQSIQKQIHSISQKLQHVTTTRNEVRQKREQLEQQLLSAAQAGPSEKTLLQEQLRVATAEYSQSQQHAARIQKEREQLEVLLSQATAEKTSADLALKQTKETSSYLTWARQVRNILAETHHVFETLLTSKKANTKAIQILDQDIQHILQSEDDTTAVQMSQSLISELMEPFERLARLTAIEEERARQLESLPQVSVISDARIQELQQQIEALPDDATTNPAAIEQELSAVREKEFVVERDRNFTQAKLTNIYQAQKDLEQEILRESGSEMFEAVKARTVVVPDPPSNEEMYELRARLSQLGEVDPLALKEHEEVRERYTHFQQQLMDIEASEANIVQLQAKLEQTIHTQFSTQFSIIQQAFSSYFSELFGGGKAFLQETQEGIEIIAQPPHKKIRSVQLLSGGEKALSSLALLLAILEVQTPPFIVFDEVDAALDEANSERLVSILDQKATGTQCIVISHNRQTMAKAAVLYGVTMQPDGSSKVYSVRMQDIVAPQEAEIAISV